MLRYFLAFTICTILIACNQDNRQAASEKSVQEIKLQEPIRNSQLITSPVSAVEPLDTINVAKMVFEEKSYDFGQAQVGDKIEHTYSFKNTGKVPLIITNAKSTCGCTVPQYPKEPIPPGEGGIIKVVFNTKGKTGKQKKPVNITANTYPALTTVHIQGEVLNNDVKE